LRENEIIVLVGLSKSQIKKLPKKIIGISKTENQLELSDLYNSSDVFLNLSVEETFGLTTAEALACGTPAIVYNSTASPELIDSKTGIVVKKNDISGLLNAIQEIKSKGKLFYSKSCRKRAVKLFNRDKRFKQYFELYNRLIKTHSLISK